MKIIFKKSIVERLSELLDNEVYSKNLPEGKVDYILLTEKEALELYNGRVYPYKVFYMFDKDRIEQIHQSSFRGIRTKVEGY